MIRRDFLHALGGAALIPGASGAPMGNGFLPQSNLGVNVPLSGPLARYGQEIVKGVQACIDETNRYMSTMNRVWGLRTFDDQSSSAVATSNVFVAASDPTVIGMIGNLTADVTLACLPQYANASFALVVPCVTADSITARGYRNVFRLPTKDSTEGALFARAALPKAAQSVVAVAAEGDYGGDVAQGFVAQAKADKRNAETVAIGEGADPANSAAIVLRSKPSFVFLAGKPDMLGPVVKALRAQGYRGDFGASDAFFTTSVVGPYGDAMNGALVATSTPPLERVPTIITLVQDFHSEVGQITAFSAYGYAAAQLLIMAAGRSNAHDRFTILTQLQQGGSYNLIVGQFAFSFNGDASLPNIYFYRLTPRGFTYARSAVPNGFVV